ncbi:MAG: CocE/NonD family hydrolase [Solirubrobacteraceae bacterium]
MRRLAGVLGAAALLLAGAPAAEARDVTVRSFDGTPIAASFLPAPDGGRAPTVLMTHGWGLVRDRGDDSGGTAMFGSVGAATLQRAGYNVLTWDSRGFGESGGTVMVDHRDFEGRDVQALLDWLATQPEAQLDGPGDPRAGMHGASYAGGIEFVAAAVDRRIDAIAPAIAWHSLTTALYRDELVKSGWGLALGGLGLPTATLLGVIAPSGVQTGTLDPHILSALLSGAATGRLSAEDERWFADRGPGDAVGDIRAPTLILQGTADTLFTPSEAIRNHALLQEAGVPLKMVWFCGGHGVCLTGDDDPGRVERTVLTWLDRHLRGNAAADTGPAFEWLADDGVWRTAGRFPLPTGAPLGAAGSGRLVLAPADPPSGTPITAGPALNAVNVPIPAPAARTDVVGEPRLTLRYRGTGLTRSTHVFAQIVDRTRGLVLGNQATPVAITLDGREHTITRSLEGVAASAGPGSRYVLQVAGSSSLYGPARGAGVVDLEALRVALPTAAAGSAAPGA